MRKEYTCPKCRTTRTPKLKQWATQKGKCPVSEHNDNDVVECQRCYYLGYYKEWLRRSDK